MSFVFVGNDLALDFINSQSSAGDVLVDYAAFVAWLEAAQVISREQARAACTHAESSAAQATYTMAVALRAGIRGAVEAIAGGRLPTQSHLAAVNTALEQPPHVDRIIVSKGKITSVRVFDSAELGRLIFPVAEAARRLLTERDLTAIRRCAGEACTHYFYDASHNRTRRWCSMAGCGNREKVAALRARRRAKLSDPSNAG